MSNVPLLQGGREKPFLFTLRHLFLMTIVLAVPIMLAVSCQAQASAKSITVWTYDSFVSEWGPGGKIAKLYKKTEHPYQRNVVEASSVAMLPVSLAKR